MTLQEATTPLYKEWRKTSLAADIPAILARFQSILIVFYGKTKGDPCHVGLDLDSTHYVHDVLRSMMGLVARRVPACSPACGMRTAT